MERKIIGAILSDELDEFLEINKLYDQFKNKEILCKFCNTPITSENISSIFYKDGIQFCCDNLDCIQKITTGGK